MIYTTLPQGYKRSEQLLGTRDFLVACGALGMWLLQVVTHAFVSFLGIQLPLLKGPIVLWSFKEPQ